VLSHNLVLHIVLGVELAGTNDIEVVYLDESHFSNEPYVVRGWHKKGQPFSPADAEKQSGVIHFRGLRAKDKIFLLEKFPEKQC
jgi:hypothetical protein